MTATIALEPITAKPSNCITYQLDGETCVQITVYNRLGHPVKSLLNGNQGPGHYRLGWDGRNKFGRPLEAGLYLAKIKTGTSPQRTQAFLLV